MSNVAEAASKSNLLEPEDLGSGFRALGSGFWV